MSTKRKTTSNHNLAKTCATELSLAKNKLHELKIKVKISGPYPHADFWHQSLHEAEERVRRATMCKLIPEEDDLIQPLAIQRDLNG